jgi:hypothetical protein
MKKSALNLPLVVMIFILTSHSLTAQIGARIQQGKIYGVWQNSDAGFQMTLILNENGTGEFDGEEIKFSTQGDKLSLQQHGNTETYTFVLQGNLLKISGGDLDAAMTFMRNGKNEQPATVNTNPSPSQKQPGPSSAAIDNNLVGVWSGNNEKMEFKSNGQCLYGNQTFTYEISQGHILLTTSQGKVMMAYVVTGDQLTMTINGQKAVYTRGAGNMNTPAANAGSPQGGTAMELVGKWCYVNVISGNTGGSTAQECIVLNGDGTYQYYSERSMSTNMPTYWGGTSSQNGDNGTWSVQGNRIYYNSVKSGQGSYQLQKMNHPKNNDPMIVLDGKTFVTQYQKAPW